MQIRVVRIDVAMIRLNQPRDVWICSDYEFYTNSDFVHKFWLCTQTLIMYTNSDYVHKNVAHIISIL